MIRRQKIMLDSADKLVSKMMGKARKAHIKKPLNKS